MNYIKNNFYEKPFEVKSKINFSEGKVEKNIIVVDIKSDEKLN